MFLVCGEALFDVFIDPAGSNWPNWSLTAVPGGSPFNVAIGLARLGQPAALLGGLSADFLGQQLLAVLQQEGVDTRHLAIRQQATTLAMVGVDNHGHPQYSFYNHNAPEASLTGQDLPSLDDSITGIQLGSYALVSSPTAETLQQLVQQNPHRLISLDPNIRLNVEPNLQRWHDILGFHTRHAHLIKVSDEDLQLLYPDQPVETSARQWLAHQCQLVLLTRGAKGVTVFSREHGQWDLPALPIHVADTVGAGDSFQAALLCYLAEHAQATPQGLAGMTKADIDAMARFATHAASITCSRQGPNLPRRNELQA